MNIGLASIAAPAITGKELCQAWNTLWTDHRFSRSITGLRVRGDIADRKTIDGA